MNMANTNVTMRMDETLKAQLQELMSNLGLDLTTFFTMAAKQAVREQALPFQPNMNTGVYGLKAYKLAMQNTNYNNNGKAVISSDDEWREESEWDEEYILVLKKLDYFGSDKVTTLDVISIYNDIYNIEESEWDYMFEQMKKERGIE